MSFTQIWLKHNLLHEYDIDDVEQELNPYMFAISHSWKQETFEPFNVGEIKPTHKYYTHNGIHFHVHFFNSCEAIFKFNYVVWIIRLVTSIA